MLVQGHNLRLLVEAGGRGTGSTQHQKTRTVSKYAKERKRAQKSFSVLNLRTTRFETTRFGNSSQNFEILRLKLYLVGISEPKKNI